jgi:hypothetical protein
MENYNLLKLKILLSQSDSPIKGSTKAVTIIESQVIRKGSGFQIV